jgi:hypothetical protein
MKTPMFMLPADGARRIRAAQAERGEIAMAHHRPDDSYVVTKFRDGPAGVLLPVTVPRPQESLRRTEAVSYVGTWVRSTVEAQIYHYMLLRRPGRCISTDALNRLMPGFAKPRRDKLLVIGHLPPTVQDPENRLSEFVGWEVTPEEASPVDLEVEPDEHGLVQLEGHWPVETLRDRSVLVVGVGSLGSAVAAALAAYGVGRVDLLDPDRLLWHNTVRHFLDDRDVGRYKTDAVAERLMARWPGLDARSHVLDVVGHADRVRALLPDMHAVVCAADGIAPRRVVSHLARRAGRDAVLTSILENGVLGEVLRLRRAPDQGCLICRRADLYDASRMEPERAQERGYGDGDPHQPMTAVGPDIAFLGQLAAKVAVASVLERSGRIDQRLPGEHAVVGLRVRSPYKSPYDVTHTGDIRWHPASPPRHGCVTCSDP